MWGAPDKALEGKELDTDALCYKCVGDEESREADEEFRRPAGEDAVDHVRWANCMIKSNARIIILTTLCTP